MQIIATPLAGCVYIQPATFADHRGRFNKTFHADIFREYGLVDRFDETFYIVSHKRVLRGFHFQMPPAQHAKLVYCMSGAVLDAVVDIRKDSPTAGQYVTAELSSERGNMVYIPEGFAHAWYALTEGVTVSYHTSTVFSAVHDAGVHWDSFGVAWPDRDPILSAKDVALPRWEDFDNPFRMTGLPHNLPGAGL